MRFLTQRVDPCGRLFDQMCMAARSAAANIAEGHARRSTSRETQMRLYDVARGSLAELAGDYRSWLMLADEASWADADPEARAVFATPLDKPSFDRDLDRNAALHVLAQARKFDRWLAGDDSIAAARAMLVLAARTQMALSRQLERAHADFVGEGGFAENLTKDRLAARGARCRARRRRFGADVPEMREANAGTHRPARRPRREALLELHRLPRVQRHTAA